jgi:hypothetical protein
MEIGRRNWSPAEIGRQTERSLMLRNGLKTFRLVTNFVNGRGSVMVYNSESDRVGCWFAAFKRQQEWALHATKGASNSDVERFLKKLRKN